MAGPSATEVRWVRSGGSQVAFQVVGEGTHDVLQLHTWFSSVDADWDDPVTARDLRRLAASCRVIRFDKSGCGSSDRVVPSSSEALDVWSDEAIGVMDAVGVEQFSVEASGWSGPLAIHLAARHPDRITRLVLTGTFARLVADDQNPGAVDPAFVEAGVELLVANWGTGVLVDVLGIEPGSYGRERLARYERAAAARGDVRALCEALVHADARPALATIAAETLIVDVENPLIGPQQAHYLASAIPRARMAEIPREWRWQVAGDAPSAELPLIIEFLTGTHTEREVERQVVVMMFADVVGSTGVATRLGDREWADVLRELSHGTSLLVEQHAGHLVDQVGDGFLILFGTASRAIACARELVGLGERLGTPLRIGVHAGECHVNGKDLRGVSIHAGARIMAMAGRSEIVVSDVARSLADGRAHFATRGVHELRGVPGNFELFTVTD